MERDIRRIEGVVSCLVTDAEIVVLVEPTIDASAVQEAVVAIVASAGDPHEIRVAGGFVPVARSALGARAFRPAALVAAITATAALGVGSLVGGWLGSIDRTPRASAPSTAPDVPPVVIAEPPVTEPAPEQEAPPRRAVRIVSASGDVTPAAPQVPEAVPPPARAPDLDRPPPLVVATAHPGKALWRACEVHPVIEVLAAERGEHRGNGPSIWSRSIKLRDLGECWWGRPR